MINPDTPLLLALEMRAVMFGPLLVVVIVAAALVFLIRPWRVRSRLHGWRRVIMTTLVILVALPLIWLAILAGAGKMLEHPRYRAHYTCDPCM